jgi:3-dehydroquinate dehydratase-1
LNKICVSLAAPSKRILLQDVNRALNEGADFVEIRFDFLELCEIEPVLNELKLIAKRAIFTLRPTTSGGRFGGTFNERILVLKKMASFSPMLIDIEFETIRRDTKILNYLKNQNIQIMVSWHDFEGTPPKLKLVKRLKEMYKYSAKLKIVTTAKKSEDVWRILDLYSVGNYSSLSLVAFAMGDIGIVSRLLCTLYGNAPFTYASLDKPIAPGQVCIRTLRNLYSGIEKNLDRHG